MQIKNMFSKNNFVRKINGKSMFKIFGPLSLRGGKSHSRSLITESCCNFVPTEPISVFLVSKYLGCLARAENLENSIHNWIYYQAINNENPPSEKTRIEHFQNIEKLGNPGRRIFLWILEKNKTPPEAKFFEKQ